MSTAVFTQVNQALKTLLDKALTDVSGTPVVVFTPPGGDEPGDEVNQVSVWLYQVMVDEFSRNVPPAEAEGGDKRVRFRLPPLGVNLFYLITPLQKNPESAQTALAFVLLALHETPVLSVVEPNSEVNERVRVSFLPDSLDDRIKLWESLSKPYRLSVSYVARTVRLASKQTTTAAPVGSTTVGFGDTQPLKR